MTVVEMLKFGSLKKRWNWRNRKLDICKIQKLAHEEIAKNKLLAPFYKETDVKTLVSHQAAFFHAFSVDKANNDYLTKIHRPFVEQGLNDEHFDEFVRVVTRISCELGLPEKQFNEIVEYVEEYRHVILGRSDTNSE